MAQKGKQKGHFPEKRIGRKGGKRTQMSWLNGHHQIAEICRMRPDDIINIWAESQDVIEREAELLEPLRSHKVPIHVGTTDDMPPTDRRARGLYACVRVAPSLTEDDWEAAIANAETPMIAVDACSDPRNLGALARGCAVAGGKGIVVPRHRAPPVTATIRRTASGAMDIVPYYRVSNMVRALQYAIDAGYQIIGLAEEGAKELQQINLDQRVVFVVGSEGEGLRRLTKSTCTDLARLMTRGIMTTHNMAVSSTLALYEYHRQHSANIGEE